MHTATPTIADRVATPTAAPTRSKPWIGQVYNGLFYVSSIFLVFTIGAVSRELDWPVAHWMRDAFMAARALTGQQLIEEAEYQPLLWSPAKFDAKGLAQFDENAVEDGYTLYTAADSHRAILLNRTGEKAFEWDAQYSKVFPDSNILKWISDRSILLRRTHAFPNGDLLALYETPSYTPSGCGLAKLNHNGEAKWTFTEPAHHDFSIGPDGNIFVLTNGIRRTPLENWNHLELPFIDEFVCVLSEDGQLQKKLSLFEMLGKSPFHRRLVVQCDQMGDVLHSNTVNVIGQGFASHHPAVSAGDVMVCLRNIDLVIVINIEREKIVWAITGPWHTPHDPDPLANGNLLIFDNGFFSGMSRASRVLEYSPLDHQIKWEYAGTADDRIDSNIRSCQQLLNNGNVLITESDQGRILEVTQGNEVVWEYVHPARANGDELIPIVCGARRYSPEELEFLAD